MSNNTQELTKENKKLKEELFTSEKKLQEQENYIEQLKSRQADFPTMKEEYDRLTKNYKTVTAERDDARSQVVEAGRKVIQLEGKLASQTKPEAVSDDDLGVSPGELRSLAALCLPACKEEGGRPWNPATLEHNVDPYTNAALAFAKALIRKTS